MQSVGLRELKARLSAWVRRVEAGEVVLVTRRGVVAAELRPPPPDAPAGARASLRRLAELRRVRLGATHRPDVYRLLPPAGPPGLAQQLLDEDRDER